MAERWFLVWHNDIWRRVGATRNRRYEFVLRGVKHGPWVAFAYPRRALEREATLRILFDYYWWTFPPGRWRFGGAWKT